MNADRNLLFGILAFQNNFIDRQALLNAFDRWTTAKVRPLGEILVELGAMEAPQRQLLEALVAEHLRKHGDDPEKSLAAITPVGSVRDELKRLADPDVEGSLAHVATANPADDPSATRTVSAGTSSSSGLRFTVLRPHAKGGLGQVSVALDEELDREVAFKEIQDRHADNPDSRGRFLLEAKVTGCLEHPSIVPVYGLGSYADGRPFYAMRFIKGDSLKEAIKQFHQANAAGRDLTERTAELRKLLGRFLDVCNAIEYAHSRGVLHRDLKPGNIMLGHYGETLVVDWGLAKVIGRSETPSANNELAIKHSLSSGSAATQMGQAIGTPAYMSPEQAAGRWDELGRESDVYSLGATLYTLLTGQAPIGDGESMDVVARAVNGDFPAPRTVDKLVPRALEAICLKAMALKPADRYGSPRVLADDIERWLNDQPVSVHRDPFYRQMMRWVRNHRGLAGAAAAGVAVLFAGGIVASTLSRFANERTRALAVAESILTSTPDGVPYTLANLRPIGRHAVIRLQEHLANEDADPVQRLHAAFALADLGDAPQEFLLDALVTAPEGECRNLVAALEHLRESALPQLAKSAESAEDPGAKARLAIVALQLGDPKPAQQALALRSDPKSRTALIHGFAAWHGDVAQVAESLTATDDAAFRSGLCAALGTITPQPNEREAAVKTLKELYANAPDGGTHAAAGWALRQWKQELPAITATSRPPNNRRWFVNGQGMTMVEVPADTFTMGKPGERPAREKESAAAFAPVPQVEMPNNNEWPAHDVTITQAFYIADREVTVEQFQRFITDAEDLAAEKPQSWRERFELFREFSPTPDCPVSGVNWLDAVLFCNWLSTRENRKRCYERSVEKNREGHDVWRCNFASNGYRLPTESEWEYAARARVLSEFGFGSDEDLLPQYACFIMNSKSRLWSGGGKLPNTFGLFDMHGNVSEWCWDWNGSYTDEAARDPAGPAAGSFRALRGGSFGDIAFGCRCARRDASHPLNCANGNGFRVVCGR